MRQLQLLVLQLGHHGLADALRLPMLLLPAGAAFRQDAVQRQHSAAAAAPQTLVRGLLARSATTPQLLLSGAAVDAVDVVLQADLENAVRAAAPPVLLRLLLALRRGGRSRQPRRSQGIGLRTVTGTIVA